MAQSLIQAGKERLSLTLQFRQLGQVQDPLLFQGSETQVGALNREICFTDAGLLLAVISPGRFQLPLQLVNGQRNLIEPGFCLCPFGVLSRRVAAVQAQPEQ